MFDKNFILHLSLIDGIGPGVIQIIIRNNKSDVCASDLYLFSAVDWIQCYGVTQGTAQKIVTGLANKKNLETELYLIEKHQIQWVTILDKEYPALLREIYMPPSVIYWQGELLFDNKKHIAMVGSRIANIYGERVVATLVPDLVAADVVIVSGGAFGIDALAHDTTIKYGGKTIVVLGSGLLKPTLSFHKELFKRVIDSGGLVVSSFPLLAGAKPGNFPARNRIIAGLSHGCVIVQAAQKSGALITAHYALEQGREVFAVPGAIDDPLSVGCHGLIQNGAKLVMSAADIVQECASPVHKIMRDVQTTLHDAQRLVKKEVSKKITVQRDSVENVVMLDSYSDAQKKIIKACRNSVSLDDIVQATGLDMYVVQMELFNLHLDGKVLQDFIGMWIVNR